jgi:outer membrane protein
VKRVTLAVLAVTACMVGAGSMAVVQAEEVLRVGVLDVRKVMVESKTGQQHRAELEKMIKERRDKLSKEEASIKALQEKLEKDKLVLTDKQKEQKQKEVEDKIGVLKKMSQDAQQEVAKRDGELSTKASGVVRDLINDIAKQEKLALVVDKNQSVIFWVAQEVDITDRVLKAYEAKTSK